MASGEKETVPIKEGLWTEDGEPQLVASKCPSCGEVFWPVSQKGLCIHCQHVGLDDIKLSRRGVIFTFSVVHQRPARFYPQDAPVPYAFGWVTLPEGVQVRSLFTGAPMDKIKIGQAVEMVVERLGTDEQGREVMTYKFRPVAG